MLPVALSVLQYHDASETAQSETDAALADLRAQYARGDLTEGAFERRIERVLETESSRRAAGYRTDRRTNE